MVRQQPGCAPQNTAQSAPKNPTQPQHTSLQMVQAGSLDDDVATLKSFMDGKAVLDFNQPPIANFDDLERMELALTKLNQPVVDPALYADFNDEPAWLKVHAERLIDAMRNLDRIEDRAKLLNGGDSIAVTGIKAKKPIELLICAWKLLVCPILSDAKIFYASLIDK